MKKETILKRISEIETLLSLDNFPSEGNKWEALDELDRLNNKLKWMADGRKWFNVKYNAGRVKYACSYHDGTKTHGDGSMFFDVMTFTNENNLMSLIRTLRDDGYQELIKRK